MVTVYGFRKKRKSGQQIYFGGGCKYASVSSSPQHFYGHMNPATEVPRVLHKPETTSTNPNIVTMLHLIFV